MHYPRWVYQLPGVPLLRERRHRQYFLSPRGFSSHLGRYASFDQARATLPPSPGFDRAELAEEYVDVRTRRVFPYDYPVLFWLDRALRAGATAVADIGGSVGVHYHAYRRYLDYPPELRWTVFEVPAIVEIGQALARRAEASSLRFTSELDADFLDADVWLSAGALQYIEEATPRRLLSLTRRLPDHVLLNKLPLYDGTTFVTTQNIGRGSFAPVYTFNRTELISAFTDAGYAQVDTWAVPERDFSLPGDDGPHFEAFSGIYLRRTAAGV